MTVHPKTSLPTADWLRAEHVHRLASAPRCDLLSSSWLARPSPAEALELGKCRGPSLGCPVLKVKSGQGTYVEDTEAQGHSENSSHLAAGRKQSLKVEGPGVLRWSSSIDLGHCADNYLISGSH